MVQIAPQEWFSAAELAELALPGLPTTERGVQLRAKTEGWAERRDGDGQPMARRRKGRGGGMEYHRSLLPEQAQLSLAAREARSAKTERPDRESMWLRFDRAPEGVKAEATRRLGVIQDVEKLMRAGASKERSIEFVVGQARREARAAGQDAPFSVRTVHSLSLIHI
jgi:putative transposase